MMYVIGLVLIMFFVMCMAELQAAVNKRERLLVELHEIAKQRYGKSQTDRMRLFEEISEKLGCPPDVQQYTNILDKLQGERSI